MGAAAGKQAAEDLNAAIHRGDLGAVRSLVDGLATSAASSSSSGDGGGSEASSVVCEPGASGLAPVHLAARLGRRELLEVLLDAVGGAGVDALDSMQWTPLHHAASHKGAVTAAFGGMACSSCVGDLLRRRADPCVASADGVTPLDLARRAGCLSCVRALEARVALWQGWVEHFELRMLILPTWTRRWLVLLRDRRQNTGPSFIARGKLHNTLKELGSFVRPSANDACPKCGKNVVVPDLVHSFRCPSCSEELLPPASVQLALYDPAPGSSGAAAEAVNPTAAPAVALPLPQDASSLEAGAICHDESAADALFEGRLGVALQRAVAGSASTARGVQLKILGVAGGGIIEHKFRVGSISEQQGLLSALLQAASAASTPSLASCALATPSSAVALQPTAPPSWQALAGLPGGTAAGGGSWACDHCTYLHEGAEAEFAACALCQAPRSIAATAAPGASTEDLPALCGLPSNALASQQALREAPSATDLGGGDGGGGAVSSAPLPPTLQPLASGSAGGADGMANDSKETGLCAVCLEAEADSACVPCGHLCGCYRCLSACAAAASAGGEALCPMCRGPITSVVRIYRG